MAGTLKISPQYLAEGPRIAIRGWTRRDRSSIERWPSEELPAHWRLIGSDAGERQQFAVLCDGTLIGRITLREIAAKSARIGIVMHPEYRGQGLGAEALRTFVIVARQPLHLSVMRLDVAEDNVGARRCYEQAGWVEIGHLDREGHRYIEMARGVW